MLYDAATLATGPQAPAAPIQHGVNHANQILPVSRQVSTDGCAQLPAEAWLDRLDVMSQPLPAAEPRAVHHQDQLGCTPNQFGHDEHSFPGVVTSR
ncbi:hypothetical protein AB0B50_04060 [Streptomyces sp. NPDC041068]|uniref:hypothetical protein n=1 Tax=Streptomyces sp. NPDC041068 TaxID=3155130 RepID=UPI0033E71FEC